MVPRSPLGRGELHYALLFADDDGERDRLPPCSFLDVELRAGLAERLRDRLLRFSAGDLDLDLLFLSAPFDMDLERLRDFDRESLAFGSSLPLDTERDLFLGGVERDLERLRPDGDLLPLVLDLERDLERDSDLLPRRRGGGDRDLL